MAEDIYKDFHKIADTVRGLSIDAVQKANSGHPGLPMGCAELGAFLFGKELRYNPKNPRWHNRDRFVLSAGHGSMFLYSLLHLSGFNLSLEEIKNFRQIHSKTPGHPEYHITEGVEATTGPLGQGVGNAVGIALAMQILANKFNTEEFTLFDNKVFCLAGDGCMMEGVSSEASSFAGHLGLNNLILMYDANNICLDGPISECLSEDTKARYKAYGWDVFELDGYDFAGMEALFSELRANQSKPAFIMVHTIIGKGSPNKAGTHNAHGSPLGEEEVKLVKQDLQFPEEPFYIPQSVQSFFENRQEKLREMEEEWNDLHRKWASANPELSKEYEQMVNKTIPDSLEKDLYSLSIKNPIAGRSASHAVLQYLSKTLPFLYGGSADLSGSDMTMMKDYPILHPNNLKGRNIKFGVREFGMGTIVNGMSTTDFILPYCGTFLTFSDYMRNSIRLAALSSYHVIYQFTHDSIFLGEDGPTHQPIEHYAALRAIPNLQVIRPGDANEVCMAWIAALQYQGPTAIILTRQPLPLLEETKVSFNKGVGKGAYIIHDSKGKLDFTILATGSELHLAKEVCERLEKLNKKVRLISIPCWSLFDKQPEEYKKSLLGKDAATKISIEAGSDMGWAKYIGIDGLAISIEGFGHSAPIRDLAQEFGFTVDSILERILSFIK